MRLRRIVIMLDGSPSDGPLLRQGVGLCREHEARLDALFVRRNLASGADFLGDSFSTYGMEAVLEALADAAAKASAAAHAAFETVADEADEAVIGKFIEYIGLPEEALADEGRLCDLFVMAKPEGRAGAAALQSISMAATRSGRPVLLLPAERDPEAGFKRMAIAWDGSLEAMRAMVGAMPMLQAADAVAVLRAGRGAEASDQLAEVAAYLDLHCVTAATSTIALEGRSASEVLIDAATADHTDLLVMGGFGAPILLRALGRDETTSLIDGTSFAVLLAH
ncbi:universal stress protein [Maricaulis salignorans]|uniref:Universal stress protein family protein n=1 Tax=Maricaulis salignorans TaxID=144026 RepID=A0A1G9LIQ7_9PROT|nr:universal stress protein [Maricaulis salignorans]SDL61829.1 Universal stress protein family protein [Maricaulis salignorans]